MSTVTPPSVQGAGLGLRRSMLNALNDETLAAVDFMEVAPENWIDVGGRFGKQFGLIAEAVPFVTHGLSLSLGGPSPIDTNLVSNIKTFLDRYNIDTYSEHLSYCSDQGHLYDLMPIPFTEQAVTHVVSRIHQVQDILKRPLVIENVSYYAAPGQEMQEFEFLKSVISRSGCGLLLDVNNIYVNSINHGYDAESFLHQMPGEHIVYMHVAGHYNEADDLIVDTHGADVIDPVWNLLEKAYQIFGVKPTLLERDFNIPAMDVLVREVERIRSIQSQHQADNPQAIPREQRVPVRTT
ncbi:DUF692 domain-containing protein [Ketobacter sp. MCCC 1A13808]|uniref:HvfB family MNIO-type RiPP peptide maturase n=1 Tax=Ketobacter sp. MCCC 1A13808 TaxID=2602738 RepID=UPI0012EC819A|nr:DUF692 domain-containing protein [Ketobacter sp. MCCC 1A13808]MVF10639.1 DUF692 domain-containing protein [Ketobacter sp. MCCC 1A13808]